MSSNQWILFTNFLLYCLEKIYLNHDDLGMLNKRTRKPKFIKHSKLILLFRWLFQAIWECGKIPKLTKSTYFILYSYLSSFSRFDLLAWVLSVFLECVDVISTLAWVVSWVHVFLPPHETLILSFWKVLNLK